MKDKGLRKYIILIAVLLIALVIVELNRKDPVDWTPIFINTDKNPYGTYITYDLLKEAFPPQNIRSSRLPITNELGYFMADEDEWTYSEWEEDSARLPVEKMYKNTSYIFIGQDFGISRPYSVPVRYGVDKLDIKNLLGFVEEGNNVFIAAEKFSPLLLDTLRLKIESNRISSDSAYVFNDFKGKNYPYTAVRYGQYYINTDSCRVATKVLAESSKGKHIVFLKIKWGEGFIYLNTIPTAFSNVEMLNTGKYDFAFTCLSYLPENSDIIWDEYQKQGRVGEHSSFRVIWNHPALLFAYYIALIGALLFMIFRSKRTQRIIPVVEPPKNTSLEFLDTISNLYYQKQAYESIVEKRHAYFLDVIRIRYYIKTEKIDSEFIDTLSLKSGINKNTIEAIFDLYAQIQSVYDVSNTMLLKYNEKLEEFYKEMK